MSTKAVMAQPSPFVRDRFTWLLYGLLAYFSYFLNSLGPVMTFLRVELEGGYSFSSLHFSAFAVGMLVAGFSSDLVATRLGRMTTMWLGSGGVAAGALLLVSGSHAAVTLLGVFLMGASGAYTVIAVQASLSDLHGDLRGVALTEANTVASLCSALAPVAVGGLAATTLGWRGALILAIAALIAIRLGARKAPALPTAATRKRARSRAPLPLEYWIYWIVLMLGVAVEFCIIAWCPEFLKGARGLSAADAASSGSLFLVAMVLGRLAGSRLVRHVPGRALLAGTLLVAISGFLVHWLAPGVGLSIVGLMLTGLGVAMLYPLTLSIAVGTAPELADSASSRASLASGSAVLLLPLVLGSAADRLGIETAYGGVLLLALLAFAISTVAPRIMGGRVRRLHP